MLLTLYGLSQEHRELAREAVRKSLVLLKNGKYSNQPLLPLLKKAPKILVAGSHADDIGNQCGGWTITWQGASGNTTDGDFSINLLFSTLFPLLCWYSSVFFSLFVLTNQ